MIKAAGQTKLVMILKRKTMEKNSSVLTGVLKNVIHK
jgi:hypothetical protein